jgi:very-short-patch-repair endonuclease/ribosomal protein S27AE
MVALLKKSKRTCQKCGGPIMGKHARVYCGVVCAGIAPRLKKCKECGEIFRAKDGALFCGRSCSGHFNGRAKTYKHSAETKEKIRITNLNLKVAKAVKDGRVLQDGRLLTKKVCAECGKGFLSERKKTKTCSLVCYNALRNRLWGQNKDRQRYQGKVRIEKLMKEGRWKGWSGRGESSYPEKYVATLLSEEGLVFEREHRVLRFSIDFAFVSQKIALEVDGKQHQYPAQERHDKDRDKLLEKEGWVIFRLKWKSVRNETGKQNVHEQFESFLGLLRAS